MHFVIVLFQHWQPAEGQTAAVLLTEPALNVQQHPIKGNTVFFFGGGGLNG